MTSTTATWDRLKRAGLALVAVALAVLAVLLLLELGLRGAGWVALRARDDPASVAGARTILCLGDSWTYGMESGDPGRKSYPAQLHRMLQQQAGSPRFRVINRGIPGAHSRQINRGLAALLAEHRPSVVVLMMGGNNFFKPGDVAGRSWFSSWLRSPGRQAISGSKVLGLLHLLTRPREFIKAPPRARSLLARLHRALEEPATLAAYHRDGLGTPHAAAGHARAAEQCLYSGDLDCAEQRAQQALVARSLDPRATAVLAAAGRRRQGKFTPRAHEMLQQVVLHHPCFCPAQRLWLLALAQESPGTFCRLQDEVAEARSACPTRCHWLRGISALFERDVAQPAERMLREDLRLVHSVTRQHRARLLLLNYPTAGGQICGLQARPIIARYASRRGVPVLDLERLIGPVPMAGGGAHYGPDAHPNAVGYRKIASGVLRKLSSLGWLRRAPGAQASTD